MQFLSTFDPQGLNVLVRLDLDLPMAHRKFDTSRMEDGFATLSYLWQHHAKHVTVIAHRGHDVKKGKEFSLAPIATVLYKKLEEAKGFKKAKPAEIKEWLDVLENLRFDPREEKGDVKFAKQLAKGQDVFINDAFATAHRSHTSIVMLPKILPTYFGFQFEKEMTAMRRVTENPKRPFVFLLGGAKLETKRPLLEKISEFVNVVLVGGKLIAEINKEGYKNRRMIVGQLTPDGYDITQASAEQFSRFIAEAGTLVWNGPMGRFEDGKHTAGTKFVAEAVAMNRGYKLLGGGDTEAAVRSLKINEERAFSFISSGGGAMLYYLTYHTLPAIEAAKSKT